MIKQTPLPTDYIAVGVSVAILCLAAMVGCRTVPHSVSPPVHDVVVVVSSGKDVEVRGLTADAQTIRWTVPMPGCRILSMDRDPRGQIWIACSGKSDQEGRVSVWSPDGCAVTTFATRGRPEAGIVFARDRAYILCALRGFGGAVDVVDMDRLEYVTTWPVPPREPNGAYLLLAGAVSSGQLLVSGMTRGPEANCRYAVLSMFDVESGRMTWQSEPLKGVDIWSILPYRDGFLLLNVASDERGDAPPADLIYLDTRHNMERWSVARAPLWGILHGDILFLYHNPAWNSLKDPASRLISRVDLRTRAIKAFPLPDYWNAVDIMLQGNDVILCGGKLDDSNRSGLYRVDWAERQIRQIRSIPGVIRMR